jgi:hypothetical protein
MQMIRRSKLFGGAEKLLKNYFSLIVDEVYLWVEWKKGKRESINMLRKGICKGKWAIGQNNFLTTLHSSPLHSIPLILTCQLPYKHSIPPIPSIPSFSSILIFLQFASCLNYANSVPWLGRMNGFFRCTQSPSSPLYFSHFTGLSLAVWTSTKSKNGQFSPIPFAVFDIKRKG